MSTANENNLRRIVVPLKVQAGCMQKFFGCWNEVTFHGCWDTDFWKPKGIAAWGNAILEDMKTYNATLHLSGQNDALSLRGIWIAEALRSWQLFMLATVSNEIRRLDNLMHNASKQAEAESR